jgi:hypothetical protein
MLSYGGGAPYGFSMCEVRTEPQQIELIIFSESFGRSKNLFSKRFLVGSRGNAPCNFFSKKFSLA